MKNQDRHVASVQCHGRGDSLNLKITIKFPPDPSLRLGAACSESAGVSRTRRRSWHDARIVSPSRLSVLRFESQSICRGRRLGESPTRRGWHANPGRHGDS